MDEIFAPWRIEWIEREDKNPDVDECVFCEFPERDDDREHLIVAENDHAFVMLNNYPYNPGHVMVIPRVHTGTYEDLSDEVLLGHAQLKTRTFEAMRKAFDPDGFNAGLNLGDGSGGSIDDHLHTHIVPRWEGDTNFMPVIGDTKVIVQAVEETYDRLHTAFAGFDDTQTGSNNTAIRIDS
ncbi:MULTISPECIES: HIT family protein [Halobacteriaceae]|uniref:HIT family protein n=1 Tax=Halospeciosus flavus TaxID=3032283 RepID=A0ABD5Z083_9EURY|nr:HIT domain-containing protein [Halobacterium zhouii]